EEFHFVIEHVWSGLGEVLTILIAAPAHDIPEQHAALRGIDHVFHGRGKCAERRGQCADRGGMRLARWHCLAPCLLFSRRGKGNTPVARSCARRQPTLSSPRSSF